MFDPTTSERFPRRLFRSTATTSLTAVYTVPANRSTQVIVLTACNTDPGDYRSVTVKLGGKALFSGLLLAPGESVQTDGVEILHSEETVQIQADANGYVDVSATGIEG
jgi:hypothetical protein